MYDWQAYEELFAIVDKVGELEVSVEFAFHARECGAVTTGTGAPRAYRFGCTKLRAEKEKKGTRSCFTWTNLV